MATVNVNSSVIGDVVRWGVNTTSGRFTIAMIVSTVALSILAASVSGVVFGFGLMVAAASVEEMLVGLFLGGMGTVFASVAGTALSIWVFNEALEQFKETYNMAMAGK